MTTQSAAHDGRSYIGNACFEVKKPAAQANALRGLAHMEDFQ
jgi:hypothetical protein